MPAYLFVHLTVNDPIAFEDYRREVSAVVAKHGGEYLARGGVSQVIEGTLPEGRVVLFRFPDMAAIRAYVEDPEYAPLKALRQRVAETQVIAVEGL
jgi:uncharacterized protein (DUF1330 family)